ncbi:pectate lyase [Bacillus sp. FJAT-27225]|uniref:glycosyl hydrolase family 28-related protein n=1 Tax=Bacillus sp. FJAT-27225 TaxID=1743144 RepID=UPI00080C31B2|nr:glycosyl hydrolase family 28-related protein [Bacillus sp. FJAT-27225]OCA83046.1 pectate lyase [Bacillus sp. FJAT-27225]
MLYLDKYHDPRKNKQLIDKISAGKPDIQEAVAHTEYLFQNLNKGGRDIVRKKSISSSLWQIFHRMPSFFLAKRSRRNLQESSTQVDALGNVYPSWKPILDEEYAHLLSVAANEVNVKDFGAVGDGLTDDTEAFKKAIGSGRVIVRIPEGTFMTKEIRLPSWTCLIGEGKGKTILRLHDKAAKSSQLVTNLSHWKGNRNILVKGMTLDWNVERLGNVPKTAAGNNLSSCLLFANVTFGWVKDVEAINPGLHCFDVSSTIYNYSGDGYRARGGSNYIWLDGLNGYGFGDDGVTTHHSDNILISNCHMCDPSGRSHKKGFSNSNGFEADDGSRNVWLVNNSSTRCFGGVEIKAHHNSSAASNVHIIGHLSINDNRSFNFRHIGHHKSTDPVSRTAFDIQATNLISVAPVYSELYVGSKPRALVVSAYRNVVINHFTAIGDPDYDYGREPVMAIQYRSRNVVFDNISVSNFRTAGADVKVFGGDNCADWVAVRNLTVRDSARQAVQIGKGVKQARVGKVLALGERHTPDRKRG